jgi:hypothetical protein
MIPFIYICIFKKATTVNNKKYQTGNQRPSTVVAVMRRTPEQSKGMGKWQGLK